MKYRRGRNHFLKFSQWISSSELEMYELVKIWNGSEKEKIKFGRIFPLMNELLEPWGVFEIVQCTRRVRIKEKKEENDIWNRELGLVLFLGEYYWEDQREREKSKRVIWTGSGDLSLVKLGFLFYSYLNA